MSIVDAVAAKAPDVIAQSASIAMPVQGAAKSFGATLLDRVDDVNAKIVKADELVKSFAIDDSVPLHEVTIALEQSRLSVELMMQVRARMVEAYQEFMRMQL